MAGSGFDDLTRFGPLTPMGRLMREHWIPACKSSQLVSDGAPRRVRLLGEDFVAFRDTEGRVGILNEACPHRGVSLALGRNEECGLRCLFHGWKLDVNGRVVDTLAESERFRERLPAVHHPVEEAGGIVWTYLGSREDVPCRPNLVFTQLPPEHVFAMPAPIEANWLSVLEAGFDQVHVRILHRSALASAYPDLSMTRSMLGSSKNRFDLRSRPYGGRWAFFNTRQDGDEEIVRVGDYIFPWWDMIGLSADPDEDAAILLQVPVDDENTMLWGIFYNTEHPLREGDVGRSFADFCESPDTYRTGFPNDRDGNWGQDRSVMDEHWTGIGVGRGNVGLFYEDLALLESMSKSWDRSGEHLGSTDALITRLRRRMREMLRAHEGGGRPASIDADLSSIQPRASSEYWEDAATAARA